MATPTTLALSDEEKDRKQRAITPSRVGGGGASNFIGGNIDPTTGNLQKGTDAVQPGEKLVGATDAIDAKDRTDERDSTTTGTASNAPTLQTQARLDQISADRARAAAEAAASQQTAQAGRAAALQAAQQRTQQQQQQQQFALLQQALAQRQSPASAPAPFQPRRNSGSWLSRRIKSWF